LQKLLSDNSLTLGRIKTEQVNVPMNIRKGIQKKQEAKKAEQAKSAKDAGIILEAQVRKKGGSKRRERAVGGPSVGSFRGGMLRLSSKDLQDIQGIKRKR
jgi:hypothetical protein